MVNQRTLAATAQLEGVGLHTGQEVRLELIPAVAGTGVRFVRTDIAGAPEVRAHVGNLTSRQRRTALVSEAATKDGKKAEIHTCEHLLAALYAAQVDNVEIRMDAVEVPGMDGSALPFFEAIRTAGTVEQEAPAAEIHAGVAVAATNGDASIFAAANSDGLRVAYTLHYERAAEAGLAGGVQFLDLNITEESFAREIAPARTFVLAEEVRQLQTAGLGKGANTQNTLVIGKNGVIDNELRFPDEFVRHKILDVIGDLYLLGCRLYSRVVAVKSGHALNAQLARALLQESSRGISSGASPTTVGASAIATSTEETA